VTPPGDDRTVRRFLLATLVLVPLLPDFGRFTNADSPKWALLALLAVPALLVVGRRAVASREKVRIAFGDHLAVLAAIAIVAILVAPRAPEARATLRAWTAVGTLTALGLLASRYLRDDPWAGRAALATVLAAAFASVVGLAQRFLLGGLPASTFGNPSFAAEFVAPAALLLPVLLASDRRLPAEAPLRPAMWVSGRRLSALAAAPLLLAFLAVAKSRADWLGLVAGLLTLGLLALLPRLRRTPPLLPLAAAILACAVALPYALRALPVPLFGRSDTVAIRAHVRDAAFEMARDHPFLGVGLEGFRAHYPAYRDPREAELSLRRQVTFPHNLPAQVAAETGFGGLLVLALVLLVPIWSGLYAARSRPGDAVSRGATAAVVAIIVSAQFSEPLRHPASALLFFVLSALLVVRRPRRLVEVVSGRYRRLWPVLLLLFPASMALALAPSHLAADARLEAARSRLASSGGAADTKTIELLEASLRAEESPDPLRILAFFDTVSGHPEVALSRLGRLFALSPHDELGRIEKARALLKLGRPAEARPILESLAAARPGDEVVFVLLVIARSAEDPQGAQEEVLHCLKTAPPEKAAALARQVDIALPTFSLAMVRTAERIGATDPRRALEVLAALSGGEARYHEAVVLAAQDRLDEAMDRLRAARAEGAADGERLAADPRLAPLRLRADFDEMLRR
jgi:O-antigen ligase